MFNQGRAQFQSSKINENMHFYTKKCGYYDLIFLVPALSTELNTNTQSNNNRDTSSVVEYGGVGGGGIGHDFLCEL